MNQQKKLTLEIVAHAFAKWRINKIPGEYIPKALWLQVKAIQNNYSQGKIRRRLGINAQQFRRYVLNLNRHRGKTISHKLDVPSPRLTETFVEIDNPLTRHCDSLHLEMIRTDGMKIRCYYSNLDALHQTLAWFARSS